MSEITQTDARPLASRLKSALRTKYGFSGSSDTTCLLLDVSGSMCEYIGAGKTKIAELRKLVDDFADIRKFEFSSTCREVLNKVSDPNGGTAMHLGFRYVASKGMKHVVVITDGQPDDEQGALDAASGLQVDVFYVGPDPAPAFLRKLCNATGGQYGAANLGDIRELSGRVRETLMIEGAVKGAINL